MSQVSTLAAVLSGLVQNINIASSDLITNSVWVGGTGSSPSVQVTPSLLNSYLVNPLTTAGDLLYENSTPTPDRLPIGTTGQVLTVSGGLPAWQTPSNSGTVTSVSVVSTNGFAGTVATATSTPAITIETTVNSPVLAGNGTAISAATTTGSGSTVVLATSPSVTGLSSDTLTASGNITSTSGNISATSGTVSGTNLTTGGHASADLALAGGTMSGAINMGSNKITSLANGTASNDAANYGQLLAVAAGLSFKNAVVVATTTTLPAYTWASGAGGADTLTANANGTLTIDSVLTALGNRILVKNETGGNAPYNGIYTVTTAGASGAAYVLTRATDMQTWTQIPGSVVVAQSGTVNADSGFVCTAAPGGTLDTTNITFSEFGYFLADGTTLTLTGNTFSITSGGVGTTQLASASVTAAKLGTITDGVTLDQSGAGSTLEVKTAGIGTTQLASASVTAAKLGTITDGTTLDQSGAGSTLEIKTAGVGTTQLASASVTAAKLGTITDGVTLDQSGAGSTLEIKSAGVGTTQLAASSVTSAKIATSALDQATITGGGGTTIAVQYAPAMEQTFVSGVTLSANTSYLVRMGLTGETAGRVYLADASSAAANNKFWAIGLASGGSSGVSIGGSVTVTMLGTWTLGSSDSAFSSGSVGTPVWLSTSGTFTTTAPSTSGYACVKVGIVATTTTITMDGRQLTGVA